MRSCGNCTKCCEGYLEGTVKEKSFYKGKPCHFVSISKGCSIYKDRPKDPCSTYQCMWKQTEDLPLWMKPSDVNAIIDKRKTPNGLQYISVNEAGFRLDSRVLTWIIEYALKSNQNLLWKVDGGNHWIGSSEFNVEAAKI